MSRRQPLTPHEHLALGAELCDIDQRLLAAYLAIEQSYGPAAGRLARACRERLTKLRIYLDNRVCNELPRSVHTIDGVPITQAYFGWRDGPCLPPERLDAVNNARQQLAHAAEHVFDDGNPWRAPPLPTTAEQRENHARNADWMNAE